MAKNDYIKVSGKVMLLANAAFYREHGYKVEEPTEEEIKAEFPEYEIEAPVAPSAEEKPTEEEAPAKRKYTRKATN